MCFVLVINVAYGTDTTETKCYVTPTAVTQKAQEYSRATARDATCVGRVRKDNSRPCRIGLIMADTDEVDDETQRERIGRKKLQEDWKGRTTRRVASIESSKPPKTDSYMHDGDRERERESTRERMRKAAFNVSGKPKTGPSDQSEKCSSDSAQLNRDGFRLEQRHSHDRSLAKSSHQSMRNNTGANMKKHEWNGQGRHVCRGDPQGYSWTVRN